MVAMTAAVAKAGYGLVQAVVVVESGDTAPVAESVVATARSEGLAATAGRPPTSKL